MKGLKMFKIGASNTPEFASFKIIVNFADHGISLA